MFPEKYEIKFIDKSFLENPRVNDLLTLGDFHEGTLLECIKAR